MAQLHLLYEALLQRPLEMPSFRRSLSRMDVLRAVGEEKDVSHRPAKLFRFDEKAYKRLLRSGSTFWI